VGHRKAAIDRDEDEHPEDPGADLEHPARSPGRRGPKGEGCHPTERGDEREGEPRVFLEFRIHAMEATRGVPKTSSVGVV
jgi:hypothetical protein